MGMRGPKPKKWDPEWNPELAYAVGLFAADGCMYNDGRHFSFVSEDRDLIKIFMRCLGLKNKIGLKTSGYSGKKCPHVQWGSVAMFDWFLFIGLTPKKSKTIGAINIPDEYFFDFLRGAIDGDGSFYSYFDPRWRSSFMFYLCLSSGSKDFIYWIQEKTSKLLGVVGHISFTEKKSVYQLRYAKNESLKIIKKMYYSDTVSCLKRKRLKIEKALKQNEQIDKKRASAGIR